MCNVASPYWRPWLKPAFRCLVPVTSFSEYADTKPRKTPVWFALDESRLLFALPGIWRPWTGVREPKRDEPVPEEHRLFSFLTTEANGIVIPVHPEAMPVVLTTPEEWRTWLEAPAEEALRLQRPLPDGMMAEVARGELEGWAMRCALKDAGCSGPTLNSWRSPRPPARDDGPGAGTVDTQSRSCSFAIAGSVGTSRAFDLRPNCCSRRKMKRPLATMMPAPAIVSGPIISPKNT